MFSEAIIHYPEDQAALAFIGKELTAFRCAAVISYIDSLNFDDNQIKAVYRLLMERIAVDQGFSDNSPL